MWKGYHGRTMHCARLQYVSLSSRASFHLSSQQGIAFALHMPSWVLVTQGNASLYIRMVLIPYYLLGIIPGHGKHLMRVGIPTARAYVHVSPNPTSR